MKYPLGISNCLEDISNLSHSIVFLYFFALITEEGFLTVLCYSFELCTQMAISFLFSFAFSFSSFLSYCKASSDNHFAFLHFFFLGVVLFTASCTMSLTSIHSSQALCLSDLIPWISEIKGNSISLLMTFSNVFTLVLNNSLRALWLSWQVCLFSKALNR